MFENLFVIVFPPLPIIEREFFKAEEIIFRTFQRKFSSVKKNTNFEISTIDDFRNVKFGKSPIKPEISIF